MRTNWLSRHPGISRWIRDGQALEALKIMFQTDRENETFTKDDSSKHGTLCGFREQARRKAWEEGLLKAWSKASTRTSQGLQQGLRQGQIEDCRTSILELIAERFGFGVCRHDRPNWTMVTRPD